MKTFMAPNGIKIIGEILNGKYGEGNALCTEIGPRTREDRLILTVC